MYPQYSSGGWDWDPADLWSRLIQAVDTGDASWESVRQEVESGQELLELAAERLLARVWEDRAAEAVCLAECLQLSLAGCDYFLLDQDAEAARECWHNARCAAQHLDQEIRGDSCDLLDLTA
ncbi:MAG: hypothetical protein HY319_00040 [Armatimonadetes bacterium]|nr:hypothetical protein [Armatimonadota bacterium]